MSDAERLSAFQEAFRVLSVNGCLIIKTCTHDDLKTRLTSSFWPLALENDLLRYPTIEKVTEELSEYADISIRYMKTSVELPKEECLEEYRSRRSTNLGMLNDSDFATGIERMEEVYKTAEFIKKWFCHTFLIARKHGEM
jgi:hypothetical protein